MQGEDRLTILLQQSAVTGIDFVQVVDPEDQTLLRVFFLIPMMMSPVVVAFIVGRVMFNEAVGPINAGLHALGMAGVPWLGNSVMAFLTVLIVDTWQWTPFFMLVLLAGLSALPQEVE